MKQNKWILPFLKGNGLRIILIITLSFLTVFTAAMLTFTSGYLISKAAIPVENILLVYIPIVGVRTFGISRAVFAYLERLAGHDTVLRILSRMRVKLYRILEPQALFLKSRFKMGDMLGILAEDIEQLQYIYLRTIFPTISAIFLYIIVLIAIGMFDMTFALLIGFYLAVLLIILPILSLLFIQKKQKAYKQKRNALYQKLTDNILGVSDWVISGRAKQFIGDYEKKEAAAASINRKLQSFSRWRNFFSQGIAAVIIITLALWSSEQYAQGAISATVIAAIILVAFPVLDAFLIISDAFEKIPGYQDSLERLKKLKEEKTIYSNKDLKSIDTSRIDIELEGTSFSYLSEDNLSVSNIQLAIPQGKKIAIIGRSGAGKSTLLKLIQGALIPQKGKVLINNHDAHDYHETNSSFLSVLNQNPHLFDTTLRSNITLGVDDATEEEIKKAIKLAQLENLIDSLPDGMNTFMQETGQRFSGGEKQRVALARILLQNTPVVLMDEPNASLDPKTEKELLKTIFASLQEKSIVWITHHLVGVEEMDEILFMEDGEIIMRGTHVELMANVRYKQLYLLDHPAFQ
ncbi:thiol reductant ABC exporter subunit CydC [Niallia sp. NCCP-28]|uniref:thiol reductant ABC exporter subunit CydC n=1 Tax=Niallia sp. NCCP-28 TaxID=2934712 RepID=UPI0020868C02|nr:thiol reductant ABC exporter subunit CydC [Niallia sp. NCCP-28]GKU83739.1 ATP-binding/permease protein CydD [Niallia sp. NCCP-28]